MPPNVKRFVPWILVCLLVLLPIGVAAQEDDSYTVQLDGRKTWTLRWGLGDALGLAASGLSAGHLTLDQSLVVDVLAEAMSILSVEAHFDDRQSDDLQSLAIRLDTERLDGVVGDFVAEGIGGLTAYGKKMKGLQLEYTFGEAVLTGVASKLEGISESKTYVGQKAHDEVTYSAYSADDPPKPRPYKRGIDGLYAYPLTVFYVEEFSEVSLSFDVSGELRSALFQYGLDYLSDTLAAEPSSELEDWEFLVLDDGAQTLLLREDAIDLIRDRLEAAIDRYNEENDLSSEDAEEYPFSQDTSYELGFLDLVASHVRVAVDTEEHLILDAERNRFYDLDREGIVADSLLVEVSRDGVAYDSIDGLAFPDYTADVYSEAGILEVDFPEQFFTVASAIRVDFDYTVTGGVFMLGLSIIPESDRVSLNDEILQRDVDYMIDYEIGMLVLLVEVEETDIIRVDYERFSGGIFGSGSDYATYFYGLTLDWPISDQLSIQASMLQSAEDPASVSDPDSVETMPNRHTVAGLTGRLSLEGFSADFLVGYSDDRFPFDDNARVNQANEIEAIEATDEYVFFGHRSGLTVKRGAEWATYGASHGLAGRSVRAITVEDETLYVGTNSGLTVVSLEGLSPLDRIGNWANYYAEEDGGLPSASITSLLVLDGVLWVGTDAGLASAPVQEIDEPESWSRLDADEVGAISALAGDGGTLFVGTTDGLYQYSAISGEWTELQGSEGTLIHDLLLVDGTLYVASSRGLRSYRDGIGAGWLLLGEAVHAVEATEESVVYGSEGGLVNAADGAVLLSGVAATALDEHSGTLWVGSRADVDYDLTILSYSDTAEEFDPVETGIDGRDPFGFADADIEEHTVDGFVERVSFRRTTDGFALTGRVENVSPSYRSIGSFSRSDSTGWDVAAAWELGDEADLSLSHGYDIAGRTGEEPTTRMVNDASLRWSFGPVLTFSAHQETTNDEVDHEGPESTRTSYQFALRDELFAEWLDLGISWSDGYTWSYESGDPRRDSRLSLNAGATLLPAWEAQLDWARPIRVDDAGWSGSERLTLQTDWAGSAAGADVAVDYTFGWSRSVPAGIGRRDHELEVDVDLSSYEVREWQVTPGAAFDASSDESSLDVNARLTARGRKGGLSIQATLRGGLSGLGEPVVRESEKFSLSASYSEIEGLRPSLSYSVDRQVALYGEKRQATVGHSLTGRLTWSPGEAHHDELSFTLTSKGSQEDRRITARLENSYRLDLYEWIGDWQPEAAGETSYSAVDLRVDTDLDYLFVDGGIPDIDATMAGRLNVAFSPMWSGSFGVSYLGGTGSSGDPYHSLLLDLAFAIDF